MSVTYIDFKRKRCLTQRQHHHGQKYFAHIILPNVSVGLRLENYVSLSIVKRSVMYLIVCATMMR